jgi:hypothetical protein
MTLKRREKILLIVACGLAVVGIAWFLLVSGDSRSVETLVKDRDAKAAEVQKWEKDLDQARRDAKRLADWQKRALPPDPVVGQSRYQTWLRGVAADKFRQGLSIQPKKLDPKKDVYTKVGFDVHGQATLAGLTEFLYKFYSAGHFHQICEMKLKPVKESREQLLDVTLVIEALSLPGSKNKEELTAESGKGLQLASLADYSVPIVQRNLFAAYVRQDRRPSLDVAQYVYITGILEDNGTREVWLQDRLAGRLWKRSEGEEFQVGDAIGTVQRIVSPQSSREGRSAPAAVIVEFDNHRRRLREGDNLRGGVEVRQ